MVRQIRSALPLASVVLAGAFLAALAIVPRQRAVAEAAWKITSTTLEMMAIAGGVALCLYRAARAIARRDEGTLIAAGAYLLTALTGIAIASLLGLLDGWVTVWRAFIGVF